MADKELTLLGKEEAGRLASRISTTDNGVLVAPPSGSAYSEMMAAARMMCDADFLPKHLINRTEPAKQVANCFRMVALARTWRLDPFTVAINSYVIEGRLDFSGALLAAVINNSGMLVGRLRHTTAGDGDDMTVTVRGTLKGDSEPSTKTLRVRDCKTKTKNWERDPENQLYYGCVRSWCKLHTPELLIGFGDAEDMDFYPAARNSLTSEAGSTSDDVMPDVSLRMNVSGDTLPPIVAVSPKCSFAEQQTIHQLVLALGVGDIVHKGEIARMYNAGSPGELTSDQAKEIIRIYRIRLADREKISPTSTSAAGAGAVGEPEGHPSGGEAQTFQEALAGQAKATAAGQRPGSSASLATQAQLRVLVETRESFWSCYGWNDTTDLAKRNETWAKMLAKRGITSATQATSSQVDELTRTMDAAVQKHAADLQASGVTCTFQAPPAATVQPPAGPKS